MLSTNKFTQPDNNDPQKIKLKPTRQALFAAVALVIGVDYEKLGIDPIEGMTILNIMENLALAEKDVGFLSKVFISRNHLRVHAQAYQILIDKSKEIN